MEPQQKTILQVLKRLRTAVGYHELGMPQHALRCLDSLTSLGKIGHFSLVADVLRDEFRRHTGSQVSVANALETAARRTSTPARYMIEMTLVACYGPYDERNGDVAGIRSRVKARLLSNTRRSSDGAVGRRFAWYNRSMTYDHAQYGRWHYLLFAVALLGVAVALLVPSKPLAIILLVAAAILAFCGLVFGSLRISDEGDCVAVRFGPLPLLSKRIRYSDITGVEICRTSILDGWGIHYFPGRGWTYNIWGFACVKLTLGRKIIRVGTDDAEGLAKFVREKMGGGLSD